MKREEIRIRDPFILPYEGKYYMYGSRVGDPCATSPWGAQRGFDVYVSADLENWSEANRWTLASKRGWFAYDVLVKFLQWILCSWKCCKYNWKVERTVETQ